MIYRHQGPVIKISHDEVCIAFALTSTKTQKLSTNTTQITLKFTYQPHGMTCNLSLGAHDTKNDIIRSAYNKILRTLPQLQIVLVQNVFAKQFSYSIPNLKAHFDNLHAQWPKMYTLNAGA